MLPLRLLVAAVLVAAGGLLAAPCAGAAPVPVRDIYRSADLTQDITVGSTATIAVPDSGALGHVTVSVRLHVGDLRSIGLRLVAPDGAAYVLLQAGGASGTDLGSGASDCSGDMTTFDVVPRAGDSAGTWKLEVTNSSGTPGALFCWQLDLLHRQEVARNGSVTALLGYFHDAQAQDGRFFKNVRLRIYSSDRLVSTFSFPLQWPGRAFTKSNSVRLVDLDHDGHPEVLLWLYSGGAHCCTSVRVYTVSGTTVRPSEHDFGNPGALLRRIGRQLFFVTGDDRFSYAFTSFAGSGMPVRVLRWQSGRFADVTRAHLGLVRADRDRWWRYTADVLRQSRGDARGLLAAWAADECLLGKKPVVAAELAKLLRAGKLSHLPSEWPQGRRYVDALWKTLGRFGYTP